MNTLDSWNINVDGDANGGWIVSVHDGDEFRTYSPHAPSAKMARELAVRDHLNACHPEEFARIQADEKAEADRQAAAATEKRKADDAQKAEQQRAAAAAATTPVAVPKPAAKP